MLLDGKYSRFDAAQVSLQATDYDVYTIILKDLSHNGKYLGSLKFTNIKGLPCRRFRRQLKQLHSHQRHHSQRCS